eukprot:TRINITY_DN1199_c0_g1_i23.p1 TRINITY_DN1199_c0_g1~~TRINITY_DN1199_c0_g1_i23.p1  ORF type:complete len:322 (-),score=91.24 TRINITY_DN1199_c0_g1_i23:128-1093(-)
MIGALQANYNSRLGKMYLVNVSFGVMFIWKMVAAFINPVTRSKIKVFSSNCPKELLEDIHPSQLPRAYGGTYDPPKKAWPPAFPPQTYRDEYTTLHYTPEEFKAELLKNKEAIPSPEMAREMKGIIKGKRVPQKTYYLGNGENQVRDQQNCIIEAVAKSIPNLVQNIPNKARGEEKKVAKQVMSKPVEANDEDLLINENCESKEESALTNLPKQFPSRQPQSKQSPEPENIRSEPDINPLLDTKDVKVELAAPLKSEPVKEDGEAKVEEAKECQSVTDVQAASSSTFSGRNEIQQHNFDKAREADGLKYKKKKSCCDCLLL